MPVPPIDPTKNVLDLVNAESKYQDAMRRADKMRIDDLAALRVHYETIIEKIRSDSLDRTSTLLATQLKETKADLSDRMSKQEQFRWESGGKWSSLTFLFSIIAAIAAIVAIIVAFRGNF